MIILRKFKQREKDRNESYTWSDRHVLASTYAITIDILAIDALPCVTVMGTNTNMYGILIWKISATVIFANKHFLVTQCKIYGKCRQMRSPVGILQHCGYCSFIFSCTIIQKLSSWGFIIAFYYYMLSSWISRNIGENNFWSYTGTTSENTDFHFLVA